ncbi:MAG: cbb3-type cytochrome oxidase maturation protein [Bradyrhizobium sp.]|jgi:cbb3-type cytochrome oxidase maturation protein
MEALFLLVPLSVGVVFAAIWFFFGASDNGQFDDLVSPGWRVLHDDDRPQVNAHDHDPEDSA